MEDTNSDSSYTRCGAHAWAMGLCKSHPTHGKVLQSSLLTRAVNVMRLAIKEVKRRRQNPLKQAPQPRVKRVSYSFAWCPACHCVHTARSSTHLSRRRSALSSLWSAWLWVRALRLGA